MVSLLVCMATFFVFVCIFATRCSVHAFLAIKIMSIYPPVHLSVCLSVACGLCDKTKEPTADILNTCERAMPVVFWHEQRLVGNVLFHLKFVLRLFTSNTSTSRPVHYGQRQKTTERLQRPNALSATTF